MQISLKLIWGINHANLTVCIKFQLLVTFSSLFTASSSLSVFARSVLYVIWGISVLYFYEIQWRSIGRLIPLTEFVVCHVFPSPSFLFLLFAKLALFHILWKAPVPNLMASRGVKIEFFWKKIWIQHELNYIQEPRTISYAFHLLNMILFWRAI